MSSAAGLIQSILHTPSRLSSIHRVRIHLHKQAPKDEAGKVISQAPLLHFVQRRLPILKFHNQQVQFEFKKISTPASAQPKVGIEITKGADTYLLSSLNRTDDQLFEQILAFDRGEQVEGITQEALPEIEGQEKKSEQ